MECIYCQETSEHRILIPKPAKFVWGEAVQPLIDEGKPVCLKCLDYEMEETKEIY